MSLAEGQRYGKWEQRNDHLSPFNLANHLFLFQLEQLSVLAREGSLAGFARPLSADRSTRRSPLLDERGLWTARN